MDPSALLRLPVPPMTVTQSTLSTFITIRQAEFPEGWNFWKNESFARTQSRPLAWSLGVSCSATFLALGCVCPSCRPPLHPGRMVRSGQGPAAGPLQGVMDVPGD